MELPKKLKELEFYIENVHSVLFVALGSKSYLDKLQGDLYDKDGNFIKKMYDFHHRLKGINVAGYNNALQNYKKLTRIGSGRKTQEDQKKIEQRKLKAATDAPIKFYKDLADGNTVKINMNPIDSVSFEYGDFGVRTREVDTFVRKIKF